MRSLFPLAIFSVTMDGARTGPNTAEVAMPESSLTWRSDGSYVARWRKRRVRGYAESTRSLLDALAGWSAPPDVNSLVRAFPADPALRSHGPYAGTLPVDELKAFFLASVAPRGEVLRRLTEVRQVLADDGVGVFLAIRPLEIAETQPPLTALTAPLTAAPGTPVSHSEAYAWIDPRLVLRTGTEPGGRGSPWSAGGADAAAALAGSADPSVWLREFSRLRDPVRLVRHAGPQGPVYEVVSGARHVQLARLLDLPVMLASVREDPLPRALTCACPGEPGEEGELGRPTRMWPGLIDRGLVDGTYSEKHGVPVLALEGRLPARWVLAPATIAARTMAAYEQVYPGTAARLGIPASALGNPRQWVHWATLGSLLPQPEIAGGPAITDAPLAGPPRPGSAEWPPAWLAGGPFPVFT